VPASAAHQTKSRSTWDNADLGYREQKLRFSIQIKPTKKKTNNKKPTTMIARAPIGNISRAAYSEVASANDPHITIALPTCGRRPGPA
jgi:hypothetical protein